MAQHVNITTQKTGTVLDPCCSMFSVILCDRSEIISSPSCIVFCSKIYYLFLVSNRVRSHAHITCRKECVDSELPANSIILILILSLIMAILLHMECLAFLLLGFLMEVGWRWCLCLLQHMELCHHLLLLLQTMEPCRVLKFLTLRPICPSWSLLLRAGLLTW